MIASIQFDLIQQKTCVLYEFDKYVLNIYLLDIKFLGMQLFKVIMRLFPMIYMRIFGGSQLKFLGIRNIMDKLILTMNKMTQALYDFYFKFVKKF